MDVMGGLCDEHTAALLVAHDLGIEGVSAIKIKEITLDKKNVQFVAKVTGASDVRTFNRNDGTGGRVCNLTVADETGEITLVLWDELADAVMTGNIKDGDVLKISGYVKEGQQGMEVSVGRYGGIMPANDVRIAVRDPMIPIKDVRMGMGNVCVRALILSKQEPRSFNRKDGSKGSVQGIMIGDESGKIRLTVWDSKLKDAEALNPGDSIEVLHAYTRESMGGVEIQIGSRGILRKSEKRWSTRSRCRRSATSRPISPTTSRES